MPNKKGIQIRSTSYCSLDEIFQASCVDVWLNFKRKYVLNISSMKSLILEIDIIKKCLVADPNFIIFQNELQMLQEYKNRLENGEYLVIYYLGEEGKGIPNIYVNEEVLNRKIINNVIKLFLQQLKFLKSEPKMKWIKPTYCSILIAQF